MIIGSKYKICRRLGSGVFDQCQSPKFLLSEARHAKKVAGKGKRKQVSEFGLQLIEKQKIRFSYGITEKQLGNYVAEAISTKGAVSADKLYEFLESRLDNTIYRLGLASTRRLARQMASHGHFTVNGEKTNVPSFRLKIGDKVAVREGSKASVLFQGLDKKLETFRAPAWLSFDASALVAEVKGKPKNEDTFLNINTVLEFYSR